MHSERPSWKIKLSYFLSEIMIFLLTLFLLTITIIPRFLSGLKQTFGNIPILSRIGKIQDIAEIELFVILTLILFLIFLNKGKSFLDYWQSTSNTYVIRRFSRINGEVILNSKGKRVEQLTFAEKSYNKSVNKFYIEKRKNIIIVWLKLPETSQGMEIFEKKLEKITRKITAKNPDFYFSQENNPSYYCLVGSRKE